MKVYIGNYRNHWISPYTILNKVFFWKTNFDAFDLKDEDIPKWLDKFSEILKKFLDIVHPKMNYVKIDSHDVWDMDTTLALIILPMLKELKRQNTGSGWVTDEDVPDEIKSMNAPRVTNEYDVDDFFFDRWDYVLDEMIWAFEQIQMDSSFGYKNLSDNESIKEYHIRQDKIQNGLRLFGKYYFSLWN